MAVLQGCLALGLICSFLVLSHSLKEKENVYILYIKGEKSLLLWEGPHEAKTEALRKSEGCPGIAIRGKAGKSKA